MNTFSAKTKLVDALKSCIQSLHNMGSPEYSMNPSHFNLTLMDSYSKFLQLCIDTKSGKQGRSIHTHLITNGYVTNLVLNTKIILFYIKFGDTANARKVFDKMPERSVVSWTAMISGYAQNGHFGNALMMFSAMHRANVRANQFTYGSVLKACTMMGCLERGMQVQGCVQKSRLFENVFVQSALVNLHSKCGKMGDACYLFEMMSERDVVSWNAVIGGYAVQGFSDDSFLMFRMMLREGLMPDSFTLVSILRACSGGSNLLKISQIHAIMLRLGLGSHNIMSGSLIDAYAKCGSVTSANFVCKSMPQKDLISCTALITGYAREGCQSRDALDLFNEMIQIHMALDDVILCSMLNICANTASLSLGTQIHAFTIKYQSCNDVAMGNALIDMYAKSGEIEEAYRAFDEMETKNVISWTSLISGYAKHGDGHKAIELYKKMEGKGLKPNDVTFLSLLFACSHTGLVSEGWDCFNNMVYKYNIIPRAEHYTCMIDLYARGGQLEEAHDLISKMNVKPNASHWGAIFGACNIYRNTSLGEVAAGNLCSLNPDKSVNYVVLSSIYSAAGLWVDASNARIRMDERKITKNPAYSFIQSTKKKISLLEAV